MGFAACADMTFAPHPIVVLNAEMLQNDLAIWRSTLDILSYCADNGTMHRASHVSSIRLQDGSSIGLRGENPFALVAQLDAGLGFQSIVKLSKASGLPVGRIAAFMRIPPRTLIRRKASRIFTSEESERLLRLARLFEKTVQLFEGDIESARTWLESPRSVLAGKSPIEFGETEVGAREVEQLIGRLEHGVFS